ERMVGKKVGGLGGKFWVEGLFIGAKRGVLELAQEFPEILKSLGDVQVLPQKTRLVCVSRVRFAGLYPRKDGFLASFALHRWVDSPRIIKTADAAAVAGALRSRSIRVRPRR